MKPLLEIQTVPIAIEYKVSSAKLQRTEPVSRIVKRNTVQDARPAQVKNANRGANVDTCEIRGRRMRGLASRDNIMRANVSFYDGEGNSQKVTYSATARMMKGGQVMVDLARQRDAQELQEQTTVCIEQASLPETLSVTYQMEKLQFKMRWTDDGFEFTPASIEFAVKEYPRVVIDYIGAPLYVPPSADPDYEPIDTLA